MSFCFNCGTKVDDNARFCPECGTCLVEKPVPASATVFSEGTPRPEKPLYRKYGFLFTNVALLAQQVGSTKDVVLDEINKFIEGKKEFGVCYTLLDVSDYTFRCEDRHAALNKRSKIVDYLDVLLDAHNGEVKAGQPESTYLFIVGGNDVIPMPLGSPQYVTASGLEDPTVNSDILFACPYGEDAYQTFCSGTAFFKYEMLFMPSRLPLAADASVDDLSGYFSRALRCSSGLDLYQTYAQCDPHWKKMSSAVVEDLRSCGAFPSLNVPSAPGVLFKNIFLTPNICFENETIGRVFNREANVYFFNLHGCPYSEDSEYCGQSVDDERVWATGMLPEVLQKCESPNIIVTGACFGGRFFSSEKTYPIDLPKSMSMVQSALASKTVIFVGSSRTAFGGCETETHAPVLFGDVLSQAFFYNLLLGNDAGTSFWEARREFFRNRMFNPASYTTIVEFNLFGDPTLSAIPPEKIMSRSASGRNSESAGGTRALVARDAKIGLKEERLPVGSEESVSLLDRVRNAVNANLTQIRESITKKLYSQYGVKPRKLNSMFRLKYEDGREEILLNYDLPGSEKLKKQTLVTTDAKGVILSVALSK